MAGAAPPAARSSVLPPEQSYTRLIVCLMVLFLLALGGGALWMANAVRVARAEAHQWREAHGESKIIGRTSDEVISTYGKPYVAELGPDGRPISIVYKQAKYGQYCGIVFKDGIAVKVSFGGQ